MHLAATKPVRPIPVLRLYNEQYKYVVQQNNNQQEHEIICCIKLHDGVASRELPAKGLPLSSFIHIYVYMYVCVYIYIYICIHRERKRDISIYLSLSICIHIYIYIYTYCLAAQGLPAKGLGVLHEDAGAAGAGRRMHYRHNCMHIYIYIYTYVVHA